jgi:hypothetical protein
MIRFVWPAPAYSGAVPSATMRTASGGRDDRRQHAQNRLFDTTPAQTKKQGRVDWMAHEPVGGSFTGPPAVGFAPRKLRPPKVRRAHNMTPPLPEFHEQGTMSEEIFGNKQPRPSERRWPRSNLPEIHRPHLPTLRPETTWSALLLTARYIVI